MGVCAISGNKAFIWTGMANTIDIEQIVRDWAWREYDNTATKKQRRLKEKEQKKGSKYINVLIDWSDVKFHDGTHWPRVAEDKFDDDVIVNNNDGVDVEDRAAPAELGKTHTNVLFQTKFTNNTKDDQEYTLKTQKTTRSTCTTEVETGFTKSMELSVKLCTPGEIMEANAGYHREMSLTNTEGETIEEELSWGVESQIKVKAQHVAEAQLVVKEKKYSGDFIITSKIRGYVYVTFNNIKDNNSLIKATGHDIADIVSQHADMERRKGRALEFLEIQNSVVIIITRGKCHFRYGIRQEVNVDQKPLYVTRK